MRACHDFTIALEEAKQLEGRLFNIQAPPPFALTSASKELSLMTNHSVLRHSARQASELIQIASAFNPDAVRNFIPLKPERLMMHNFTRRFVLNFSLQGELGSELVKVIEPLTKVFLQDNPGFIDQIEPMRFTFQKQALNYLQTGDSTSMDKNFVQSIEKLKPQAKLASQEENNQAISMRVADLVVENYIKDRVNGYDMTKFLSPQGYKALPPQTQATRRTFMINGGVASGKSTSQKIQQKAATEQGINWGDVMMINRDAFKPMLLKPEEVDADYKHFFASFTEDEAYLLRDAIMQEYRERLENETAPHLYVDQVFPNLDMLVMAGGVEGKGLDLTIVQTPVENSFLMAHGRSEETGYHAVTAGVLGTHAGVPKKLLESLEQAKQQGKTNIRLTIVANLETREIKPLAKIDLKSKKSEILDNSLLLTFFRKTVINAQAKTFDQVYKADAPALETFQPMVNRLVQVAVA